MRRSPKPREWRCRSRAARKRRRAVALSCRCGPVRSGQFPPVHRAHAVLCARTAAFLSVRFRFILTLYVYCRHMMEFVGAPRHQLVRKALFLDTERFLVHVLGRWKCSFSFVLVVCYGIRHFYTNIQYIWRWLRCTVRTTGRRGTKAAFSPCYSVMKKLVETLSGL